MADRRLSESSRCSAEQTLEVTKSREMSARESSSVGSADVTAKGLSTTELDASSNKNSSEESRGTGEVSAINSTTVMVGSHNVSNHYHCDNSVVDSPHKYPATEFSSSTPSCRRPSTSEVYDNYEPSAKRALLTQEEVLYSFQGVTFKPESGPLVLFQFNKTTGTKDPESCFFTTSKAEKKFGESFHDETMHQVDLPTFRTLETEAGQLFTQVNERKRLSNIRMGQKLQKLALMRDVHKSITTYMSILTKKKISKEQSKLLAEVNGTIIGWLDGDKQKYCRHQMPCKVQQSRDGTLTYICQKEKENDGCKHVRHCWMSFYEKENPQQ